MKQSGPPSGQPPGRPCRPAETLDASLIGIAILAPLALAGLLFGHATTVKSRLRRPRG